MMMRSRILKKDSFSVVFFMVGMMVGTVAWFSPNLAAASAVHGDVYPLMDQSYLQEQSFGERVCVRNYIAEQYNPCAQGIPRYAYVREWESDKLLCTLGYDDHNCKIGSQEFDHVFASTADGQQTDQVLCVVNYHQPPISAMCASSPENFSWTSAAYPD